MVVVETHPEDVIDLRLDSPWPELQKLAWTLNFEDMDDFEHGHVPYILILLKILEQWKELVISPMSLSHTYKSPSHTFQFQHLSLSLSLSVMLL